ncbi:MAG: selenocysteine-specific translation elongation factor [Betaproteobacteria bacterium]
MIIGTAGHIDHGKTSLVEALTGVNADRLPEEKARGITIDLGFAYTPTASGSIVGFVDVPGHEKFVHTMAAGAIGMDHGLLVVAADDGLMPQTREHLRILDLLGVPQLSVAITKVDLADAERVASVTRDVLAYVASTRFGDVNAYPVSVRTHVGIDALRDSLFSLVMPESSEAPAYFRLAIDRVFVVKGMGVAVTGAVIAGRVALGDDVRLAHAGVEARVRSIHAQNQSAQHASVGERCGIVLSGVDVEHVTRGDWLVAPELDLQSVRADCLLTVPHDAERGLKDGELVLLHHGCQQVSARLILLDRAQVTAGQQAWAQIVLDRPLALCWHDRLVLRDASARHTLAGAQVMDIAPPVRGRKKQERLDVLSVLRQRDPMQALISLMDQARRPLDLTHWAAAMNRSSQELLRLLEPHLALQLQNDAQQLVLGVAAQNDLVSRVQARLDGFHVSDPDEPGLAHERLRRMAIPELEPSIFKAWLTGQIQAGTFALTGNFVHAVGHKVELSGPERILWERALPKLLDAGFDPPWVRDIAVMVNASDDEIRLLFKKQARTSALTQLVKDLFYPDATMVRMAEMIRETVAEQGFVSVISFRDKLGIGRKRAIQILEAFDRVGLTRRLVSLGRSSRTAEKDHRILRNAALYSAPKQEVST